MPKQKTRKSIAKRVKVTARGKLLRNRPGASLLKSRRPVEAVPQTEADSGQFRTADQADVEHQLGRDFPDVFPWRTVCPPELERTVQVGAH